MGSPVAFHRASNPAESGLIAPEQLRGLWPNLDLVSIEQNAAAVTLDALWHDANQAINWLVLDCLPAAVLLRGGTQLLAQADVVVVRVAVDDRLDIEPSARQSAADVLLHTAGLTCVQLLPQRHPALFYAIYVRDVACQTKELANTRTDAAHLQQQLQQAQATMGKLRVTHQAALDERDHAAAQMAAQNRDEVQAQEARINQLTQALASSEQLADQQRQQSLVDRQALDQALTDTLHLQQQLQQAKMTMEQLRTEQAKHLARALEVSEKITQQQIQQNEDYRQALKDVAAQLRHDLGWRLANVVKQVEAFSSIQNYLTFGEGLAGFNGWAISPDAGLFLIGRIRERNYDLIIEFGSGTSTAMLAKALQVARRELPHADAAKIIDEIAKPVCAFEHDATYFQKTTTLLKSQKLANQVELAHAPLKAWQDETGNYLYYDCEAMLAALAQRQSGSRKRVLVLVDGPPGATCRNARYPAVPLIFKYLTEHEIDVVLDDASRPEEKSVIDLWRTFWQQNAIRIDETSISSEKGLYFATNLILAVNNH
ncbi:TPA: hypothetical protein SIA33_001436 [Aeromonas salmonicida]|nr:hypothetical protein [Aeromonas salmonicida]